MSDPRQTSTTKPRRVYVPVKPTPLMLQAVIEANRAGDRLIPIATEYAVAEVVWTAMIAAYQEKQS